MLVMVRAAAVDMRHRSFPASAGHFTVRVAPDANDGIDCLQSNRQGGYQSLEAWKHGWALRQELRRSINMTVGRGIVNAIELHVRKVPP